jgi:hypothetical protein
VIREAIGPCPGYRFWGFQVFIGEELRPRQVDLPSIFELVPIVNTDDLAVTDHVRNNKIASNPVLKDQRRRTALTPRGVPRPTWWVWG